MGERLSAMKIRLDILRKEAETKADGYVADCLDSGVVVDGYLLLPDESYRRIQRQYFGAGDIVAAFANPAAALIKRALKIDFTDCNGCKHDRKRLNELTR